MRVIDPRVSFLQGGQVWKQLTGSQLEGSRWCPDHHHHLGMLEMQVLRLQSKPAAPDFGVEPKNLNFTSLPGDSDASSLRNTGLDEDSVNFTYID